jgi:hypothetical protein
LSSVQSGQCTPRPGDESNGADAIHSIGTAKNSVITQIAT